MSMLCVINVNENTELLEDCGASTPAQAHSTPLLRLTFLRVIHSKERVNNFPLSC